MFRSLFERHTIPGIDIKPEILYYIDMPFLAKAPPSIRILVWFIIPILLGAFLLCLPISTEGETIAFIDALFTSTSAFCVTGLVTVNTAQTFTYFGKTVILFLMQFGGLGVMAFSTLFFLAVGGKISTSQVFDIYYDRAMKSVDERKGQWFIYREMREE